MATLGSIAVKLGLDPSQFQSGLLRARASLGAFKASITDGDSSTGRFGASLDKLGTNLVAKAVDLGRFAVQAGALASAAITAAPYLLRGAQAIGSVGGAALQASPALLALGAAGEFVKLTMTRISQSVLRSLNPVVDLLNVAGAAASNVASRGLVQLSQGFARANLPAVRAGMVDIADATNTVVSGTLRWGQSTAGITAIRSLTVSTGLAMQDLAPHVVRVAESFGNMVGRISAVSLAAGSSGLSGVLDRLSGWMDRVNAATVSSGIDRLKSAYEATKGAIESVISTGQRLYGMFQANREAIGRVQDGLSLLALFTGPIGLVAGAVGLLARHWDEIKTIVEPFIGPFVAAVSNLLAQLSPLVPVVAQLAASFLQWGTVAASVLTPVLSVLVGLVQLLSPVLVPIAPVILGIVAAAKAWSIAQGILNAVLFANPIGLVVLALAALVAGIVYAWQHCETFRNIVTGAFNAVRGAVVGAINWIRDTISSWVGWLAGIGGRILAAIGDLGGDVPQRRRLDHPGHRRRYPSRLELPHRAGEQPRSLAVQCRQVSPRDPLTVEGFPGCGSQRRRRLGQRAAGLNAGGVGRHGAAVRRGRPGGHRCPDHHPDPLGDAERGRYGHLGCSAGPDRVRRV